MGSLNIYNQSEYKKVWTEKLKSCTKTYIRNAQILGIDSHKSCKDVTKAMWKSNKINQRHFTTKPYGVKSIHL
jgi:hypothetical protein